jgi:hypothetical protein
MNAATVLRWALLSSDGPPTPSRTTNHRLNERNT